ncbi:MAG: GAF domain-containing protein [Rhodospirillales bacterium]|nr:GAF domain-containing protein [Rhodospirillales bacterium]MBO6786058.1 GAF domain-containing protein [Rhodospirillales bacterium]
MADGTTETNDGLSASSLQRLIDIGIALSAERDTNVLMETILLEAKSLANADGGTLYIRTDDNRLRFEIMRTDSLEIAMGGTTGKDINFPPLMLVDPKTGEENHKNVASAAALTGNSINIPDAYENDSFDFSGTKKFDEGTGYRSKSFLCVPLKNSQNEVIGVLQLLNAVDKSSGEVIAFGDDIQPLIEALASQAAVALDNQQLLEAQKKLLDSFIELIASAIDAKSPYTGGHCQRVPELTKMLANAAADQKDGPFKDFDLTDEEWYELHIAAWLHDCGKVTTPEYVVDKATKLETIYNRIHEIRNRFEVVKRDRVIEYQNKIIDGGDPETLKAELEEQLAKLDDDFAFIAESNVGGEFMAPDRIERVKEIAEIKWTRTLSDRLGLSYEELKRVEREPEPELPHEENLLADRYDHVIYREGTEPTAEDDNPWGFKLDVPEHKYNLGEIYNLCIARGTLTEEERFKINDHIVQTIIMLEALPFPKHLARVPEMAGGHHEKMDGTGYPKKLNKDHMSVPARIMAIADIFEALTAADRPYKAPKKLSDSVKIMSFMKKDAHIDDELFELFLTSGVYKEYAERFLMPEQLDEVDISQYLPKEEAEAGDD